MARKCRVCRRECHRVGKARKFKERPVTLCCECYLNSIGRLINDQTFSKTDFCSKCKGVF